MVIGRLVTAGSNGVALLVWRFASGKNRSSDHTQAPTTPKPADVLAQDPLNNALIDLCW